MMERFKTLSPDEQQQFIARMKDRGQDASALEEAATPAPKADAAGGNMFRSKSGAQSSAQTIDALRFE